MRRSAFTVIVLSVGLSCAGLALLPLLPVKLTPSHALPELTVTFDMPGSTARVVEAEVTSRLEGLFARVEGVRTISSTSRDGSGTLVVQLDKTMPPDKARFALSTLVRQAWPSLPEGVSYPTISGSYTDDHARDPFLVYRLNGPSEPAFLSRFAEEMISPVLSRIDGVGRIEVSGAATMEWELTYDASQLELLGITPDDIRQVMAEGSRQEHLGVCRLDDSGARCRLVVTGGGAADRPDLAALAVTTPDGNRVPVDRLLTVTHREQLPTGYYRINGRNAVSLSVYAEEGANQLRTADRVKSAMQALRPTLPLGMETELSDDSTQTLSQELGTIVGRAVLTLLILLAFVLAVTRSPRRLALVTISLVVNVCLSFLFYYLLGVQIQRYSLAGITISLSLVIDNTIVMASHWTRYRNRRVFPAMLAATLTTMAALSLIFFLDDRVRRGLQDFAVVVIVNLAVSLAVALFLVPALEEKLGTAHKVRAMNPARRSRASAWGLVIRKGMGRAYDRSVLFVVRHRGLAYGAMVLAFGIPLFLLPKQVEGEGHWAHLYNTTFGSRFYQNKLRPVTDKALGGALHLFVQGVKTYGVATDDGPLRLSIHASLTNGATLQQMDAQIRRMETLLGSEKGVRQYVTRVSSPTSADITVTFHPDVEHTQYPYQLSDRVVARAVALGGGSWSVYGLPDNHDFHNGFSTSVGNYCITLRGYNYDKLQALAADMERLLLTHRRIQQVTVSSHRMYYRDQVDQYRFTPDPLQMALSEADVRGLYTGMNAYYARPLTVGTVVSEGRMEPVHLVASRSRHDDAWQLTHAPLQVGNRWSRLEQMGTFERMAMPPAIEKENQQYQLCLQYDYVGDFKQARRYQERDVATFRATLPLGYNVEGDQTLFWRDNLIPWWLLFLVVALIYVITTIVFNSLRQPLAVILTIPCAFVGAFLAFAQLRLRFDAGCFAGLVLLCGLTVNASIYVLAEYRSLLHAQPTPSAEDDVSRASRLTLYLAAVRRKAVPILLTTLSTVLGFLPFLVGTRQQGFWYPLAVCTIGGLLFSLQAVFLCLPAFVLRASPKKKKSKKDHW